MNAQVVCGTGREHLEGQVSVAGAARMRGLTAVEMKAGGVAAGENS